MIDSLDLVSDSGKALRHGVVNIVRQALAFTGDGVGLPLLDTKIDKLQQQEEGEEATKENSCMHWRPPRRAGDDFRIFDRSRMLTQLQIIVPCCRCNADVAPHSTCI